jgi:hypothetical protein
MEILTTIDFQTYLDACEHAIANFTGSDDIDSDVVQLVADLARQAVAQAEQGNYSYAESLIEKASTYVQTDLDEQELVDWLGEMDTQLDEYGIGSFL